MPATGYILGVVRAARRLLGVVPAAPVPPGMAIVTVTQDAATGQTLATTRGAHHLADGDNVVISGTSVSGYNTTWNDVVVTGVKTFRSASVAYTADSRGGRWALLVTPPATEDYHSGLRGGPVYPAVLYGGPAA